jgi:hypothetical protein
MNERRGFVFGIILVLTVAIIAGCIAPPQDSLDNVTVDHTIQKTPTETSPKTTTPQYVTEVTSYVTLISFSPSGMPTEGYHIFIAPTPLPEERSCRIYTTTQHFMYNGSAFTFNLKNPPMYINYTAKPQNITGYDVYTSRFGKKQDVAVKYDRYDPQSYLEITVRDKNTGEIYLQDGFGTDYSTYLTRTLKVMKQDDLLIEISGNKIDATINFWVKPIGNFDNPEDLTFDACTYWEVAPRDNLAMALINGTPTPTWVTPTKTTIPRTTKTPSSTS